MTEACVTWPLVALVVGVVAALAIVVIVFMLEGGEFTFWIGDKPEDW